MILTVWCMREFVTTCTLLLDHSNVWPLHSSGTVLYNLPQARCEEYTNASQCKYPRLTSERSPEQQSVRFANFTITASASELQTSMNTLPLPPQLFQVNESSQQSAKELSNELPTGAYESDKASLRAPTRAIRRIR